MCSYYCLTALSSSSSVSLSLSLSLTKRDVYLLRITSSRLSPSSQTTLNNDYVILHSFYFIFRQHRAIHALFLITFRVMALKTHFSLSGALAPLPIAVCLSHRWRLKNDLPSSRELIWHETGFLSPEICLVRLFAFPPHHHLSVAAYTKVCSSQFLSFFSLSLMCTPNDEWTNNLLSPRRQNFASLFAWMRVCVEQHFREECKSNFRSRSARTSHKFYFTHARTERSFALASSHRHKFVAEA
jgi:hypothetical protein